MNPYAYQKRQITVPSQSPKTGSWFSELVNAKIHPVVALAFVLFAAGSVAGMTALTYPEVGMALETNVVAVNHPVHNQPKVLGVSITQSIIDDMALEAAAPKGSVVFKPVSFDSTIGRWDYKIDYTVVGLNGNAVLTIGNYVVQNNITVSGTVDIGPILKPGMVYHLTLWSVDASGNKQSLDSKDLKTGKAKKTASSGSETADTSCPQPTVSSTPAGLPLCVKNSDGTVQCTHKLFCLPLMFPAAATMEGQKKAGDQFFKGQGTTTPPLTSASPTPPHMPPPPK